MNRRLASTRLLAVCALAACSSSAPLPLPGGGDPDGGSSDAASRDLATFDPLGRDLATVPPIDLATPVDPADPRCAALRLHPDCAPNAAPTPLTGGRQMVVSALSIGDFNEGVDLTCDKRVDNKLAPLGAVTNPEYAMAVQSGELLLALEIFGWTGADTTCARLAFYDAHADCPQGTSCNPFQGPSPIPLHVDAASVVGGRPAAFIPSGRVLAGRYEGDSGQLVIGGAKGFLELAFRLERVHVRADLVDSPAGARASGLLAGVWTVEALASVRVDAGGILTKDQSLLDGAFTGPLGVILNLDIDREGHYVPDVDVDGDGLESFWASREGNGPNGVTVIDRCRDGDGAEIEGADCMHARDPSGRHRFVDGLSMTMKFEAVPARLLSVR